MHFKFRHLQKIVGGFFLLTVILVIVLLTMVARGQRWFQAYTPYHCFFASGGGLAAGSTVTINGLEAGKIQHVQLTPENRVRVDLQVFSEYADRIRAESMAKLVMPIVGSAGVEIAPGPTGAAAIEPGGLIPSRVEGGGDLDALIGNANELIAELKDPQGDLMEALANTNEATKLIVEGLEAKPGRPAMLDELSSAVGHLDGVLDSLDAASPDIRDAIIEARRGLREANRVIRALQKSILLRGNIEQYLKEDSTLQYEGRAR